MPQDIEVIVEQLGANDTTATVVMLFVPDGALVKTGDRLFDVETSKAVYEVCAPAEGRLRSDLKLGDIVQLGSRVATIESASTPWRSPANADEARPASPIAARLSRDAAALAAQHGLSAQDFDAGFVTSSDVRRHLGELRAAPQISAQKREEIRALQRGAGSSLLSMVGVTLGPQLRREAEGFFDDRILDVVAWEASRIMSGFKALNAAYRHETIDYRQQVNAGVVFNGAGSLIVYGIARSDQLSLAAIQEEIVNAFRRYARGVLELQSVVRPTFTITDLSGTGIDFIAPLLPEGQSCVIGITHSLDRGYGIYLGFDHRVTDGLEAARFLQQLRARVLPYLSPRESPGV